MASPPVDIWLFRYRRVVRGEAARIPAAQRSKGANGVGTIKAGTVYRRS